MTQLPGPVDSLRSFIEQQGVVSSGDALAVLRCLSLNINASMSGAVSSQESALNEQVLRLERIEQSRLIERLDAGRRVDAFVGWSQDEAQALSGVVDELHFPAGFGPFEPLLRYQREVTMPDGTVVTEENATTASRFQGWLSDYQRSVNDLGQVVWTHVGDLDGGPQSTIVFTELETLQGVPESQVDRLQQQVEEERNSTILALATTVNAVRFTLEEWWGDVRIDDRWHRFARHNEDRRTERQAEERRTELEVGGLRDEVTQLRSRLQSLGHEWPSLAQALAALQALESDRPEVLLKGPEPATERTLPKDHEAPPRRIGDAHG